MSKELDHWSVLAGSFHSREHMRGFLGYSRERPSKQIAATRQGPSQSSVKGEGRAPILNVNKWSTSSIQVTYLTSALAGAGECTAGQNGDLSVRQQLDTFENIFLVIKIFQSHACAKTSPEGQFHGHELISQIVTRHHTLQVPLNCILLAQASAQ